MKVSTCIEGILCEEFDVDTEVGHLQHYRKGCPDIGDGLCGNLKLAEYMVKDTRVWRHLDTILKNTNLALKSINFD